MYSEIYIKPTKEKLQKKASIFGTLNNFSRHRSKNSGSAGAALASSRDGSLWARIAQNVKKPPLSVNVIDFEFFGFNVSIWVPRSPLGPKKS